jgi:nondiscriminating glutamyl-tRNA synthetase
MAAEFALDRLGRSAAIFDPVKLDWISAQYVHAMAEDRLAAEVTSALVNASRLDAAAAAAASRWIAAVAEFLRPSLSRFDQVDAQVEPIFHSGGPLGDEDRAILTEPHAPAVLRALADRLGTGAGGESAPWTTLRGEVEAASGTKGKALFQPIRVALTGRGHGRELDRLWPLITEGARSLPDRVPSARSRVARTLESIR